MQSPRLKANAMIFVDTWAWLALAYKRDPYHPAALQEHRAFQRNKTRYVTTDYVLAESMTPLFAVLNFAKARQFMVTLFQLGRAQKLVLQLHQDGRMV